MKNLVCFLALLIIGCTSAPNNKELPKAPYVLLKPKDIKGQLFLFGPELDTANCRADGGCDCCMDNLYFIDETHFIRRLYCVEGDDVVSGVYKITGNKVVLTYDKTAVSTEYNWKQDIEDTTANLINTKEFVVKPYEQQSYTDTLKASLCRTSLLFIAPGDDREFYGLIDKTTKPYIFMQQLKDSKILQALKVEWMKD